MKRPASIIAALLVAAALSACGFQLRGSDGRAAIPFKTIYLGVADTSPLGIELRRNIRARDTTIVTDPKAADASVQILAETADFGVRFSEYRLLAATGKLLNFLGVPAPADATADTRAKIGAPPADAAEPRVEQPLNIDGPIDLTHYVK